MSNYRMALLACLFGLMPLTSEVFAEIPAVHSVDRIDLNRYAGKWYEIGAFPMFFQRQCLGETTAEYSVQEDNALAVVNRCRTEHGFDQANGRAWVPDLMRNAQLKVSFFWPFRSDYWVIALAEDYRWAVVGNPNRKYLWLLSRTPQLPQSDIEQALKHAADQGYDLAQFKFTRQMEVKP